MYTGRQSKQERALRCGLLGNTVLRSREKNWESDIVAGFSVCPHGWWVAWVVWITQKDTTDQTHPGKLGRYILTRLGM